MQRFRVAPQELQKERPYIERDRWLMADGVGVVNEMDGRASLPHDVEPGAEAQLTLTVTAPQAPGEYVLEIDLVNEGVTWFYQRGSLTLRWPVRVGKVAN